MDSNSYGIKCCANFLKEGVGMVRAYEAHQLGACTPRKCMNFQPDYEAFRARLTMEVLAVTLQVDHRSHWCHAYTNYARSKTSSCTRTKTMYKLNLCHCMGRATGIQPPLGYTTGSRTVRHTSLVSSHMQNLSRLVGSYCGCSLINSFRAHQKRAKRSRNHVQHLVLNPPYKFP